MWESSRDGGFLKPQDWERGSRARVNGDMSRHEDELLRHEMSYTPLFLEAK